MRDEAEGTRAFAAPSAADFHACLAVRPEIVETWLGPVEIARRGDGPPLLSIHGALGGWDQGLLAAEPFARNGYSVIAPSRPGYLGTPLAGRTDPAGQADLLAALIDALGVGPVPVLAISAGGPCAAALARRHPGKVAALVAVVAIFRQWDKGENYGALAEAFAATPLGAGAIGRFVRRFPRPALMAFLAAESRLKPREIAERADHILEDPAKRELFQSFIAMTLRGFARRRAGLAADKATISRLGVVDLSDIACPTLIVDAAADTHAPPSHGDYAAAAIAGAELLRIPRGSHVAFWLSDEAATAQARAVAFLDLVLRRL